MNIELWEAAELYLKNAHYSHSNSEDKKAVKVRRTSFKNLKNLCSRYNRRLDGVLFEVKQAINRSIEV